MEYDYFIASRWRNRDTVLELLSKLKTKNKKVYCFMITDPYHSPDADPEQTMQEYERTENWQTHKMIKDIFEKDMRGLKESKALLLLLPAGKSAHIEAGIAYGMKKECILIGEQKEAESLYLIFDKTYTTIDSFISSL
jgi:hypothetical protein